MSTETLIKNLTDVANRLGELVATENEILRDRRPMDLEVYRDEKERLTEAYERHTAALARDKDVLKTVEPAAIDQLRSATRRFQDVLEEHRRRVQSAKTVTERMIRAITEDVASRDRMVKGYDGNAMMRPVIGRSEKAVSLALNRVV